MVMTPWGQVATYERATPQEMMLQRQHVMELQRYQGLGAYPLNYPWTEAERIRAGLGAGLDLSSITAGIATGVANDIVATVESQISPTYTYDPAAPAAPASQGYGAAALGALVRPSLTLTSRSTGALLAHYAPYGAPNPAIRTALGLGVAAGAVGIGWLVWRGLKKQRVAENPRRRQPTGRRRRRR